MYRPFEVRWRSRSLAITLLAAGVITTATTAGAGTGAASSGTAPSIVAPAVQGESASAVLPRFQSLHVPMPDGVRLAVDVWLPSGTTAGARLPTVLETDRYWRSTAYTGGIENNPDYDIANPWNARGYA